MKTIVITVLMAGSVALGNTLPPTPENTLPPTYDDSLPPTFES